MPEEARQWLTDELGAPPPPPAAGGEQGVYVDVTVGELAAIEAALRREAAASEEEAAAK